jgi:general secretion pathway protein H
MARQRAQRPERARSAGFTLIEIVCALAILALVAALILPAFPTRTSRARIEAYALETASLLIADRAAAMRRGVPVLTQLNGKARTIASGADATVVSIPKDVGFDAVLAETCAGRHPGRAIVFLANGMSCGGAIFIGRDNQAFEIRVNWLTGAVDVAPARSVSP